MYFFLIVQLQVSNSEHDAIRSLMKHQDEAFKQSLEVDRAKV